jgi:hypothetical protein
MKYLKKFENLKESNINKIYIWFDFSIIESVLENGVAFKSNDDSRYKYNLSISTTRNPKWRWGGGNCRITLDRNQISKIYKIVPYSHFGFKEWEERIFTNKNIKYLPASFFIKIELDESLKKNILPPTNIEIEYTDFKKSRIDAYGARYILPKNQIKKFESFAEYDIDEDSEHLKDLSLDLQDEGEWSITIHTNTEKYNEDEYSCKVILEPLEEFDWDGPGVAEGNDKGGKINETLIQYLENIVKYMEDYNYKIIITSADDHHIGFRFRMRLHEIHLENVEAFKKWIETELKHQTSDIMTFGFKGDYIVIEFYEKEELF